MFDRCKNEERRHGWDEWICIHYTGKTAKETLAIVHNGWIHEMDLAWARRAATDPKVDEVEAERILQKIEESVNHAYGCWRKTL